MTRFRGVIEFVLFVAIENAIHFLFDFQRYSSIRDDFFTSTYQLQLQLSN